MLIDADAISRALTASGGAAIPAIALQLGAEFITAQGALDRDRMRDKAFADPTVKRQLESIIHPLVGKTCLEQAQEAIDQGLRCAVLDIPLLVVGEVDSDGDAQTPGLAGLWVNVSELQDVWLAPSLIGDGTQTVTFVPFPGGPTLGGAAKCVGITLAEPSPNAWRVALHLVLPDGPLVEAGS